MGSRWANTNAPWLNRENSPGLQFYSIPREDHYAGGGLLKGGQDHKPNNPGMSLPAHHRKFTEVFVERDENPTLLMG